MHSKNEYRQIEAAGNGHRAQRKVDTPESQASSLAVAVLDISKSTRKLEQTAASCQSAKEALRAVTPQATLKDFHRWRATDLRWRQFARLHLAARALFSPEQLQALEVGTVADSLMRGVPQFALEGPAATSPERIPEPTEPRYEGGLARFVDEDTRLHQAACGLALLGETAWKRAWVAASLVNDTAKHLLPQ
ncbi:unnamed protein product, partial [Symbiodinium sp. KB8]